MQLWGEAVCLLCRGRVCLVRTAAWFSVAGAGAAQRVQQTHSDNGITSVACCPPSPPSSHANLFLGAGLPGSGDHFGAGFPVGTGPHVSRVEGQGEISPFTEPRRSSPGRGHSMWQPGSQHSMWALCQMSGPEQLLEPTFYSQTSQNLAPVEPTGPVGLCS